MLAFETRGGAIDRAAADLLDVAQRAVVQLASGERGVGTGTVWRVDGDGALIVTNAHVLGSGHPDRRHERGALRMLDGDGTAHDVEVLRRDDALDLALLCVASAGSLTGLCFAEQTPRVGEWVFAIGNPWGQQGVVTRGVISTVGAVATRDGRRVNAIRSDVRLAPGNSGGPLLNAAGEVVGINTMIVGGDLSVAIAASAVADWLNPQTKI